MTATILEFPGSAQSQPAIAQFIRIGETHTKIAELVSMDRFPARRAVVKASRLRFQKRLIDLFQQHGIETVLDPQVAELASLRRYNGQERHAPWARHSDGQPLGPDHFRRGARTDIIGEIARTAVEFGFDAVLSPTHYLADETDTDWFSIDLEACIALRKALDREGGKQIAIDYPVLHAAKQLQQSDIRSRILSAFGSLPAENAWFRISGVESGLGPETTRRLLTMLGGLHNIGVPVILDCLGGPTSLAAIAFGLASGRAVGIGEMERFDASEWHKPPPPPKDEDTKFGRTTRFAIEGLGRTLTSNEIKLLTEARGGKKLLVGRLGGVSDLLDNGREIHLDQISREIGQLEAVPLLRRDDWFLKTPMAQMVRTSRQVVELKPSSEQAEALKIDLDGLMKRLGNHARAMSKTQIALEAFRDSRSEDAPRARPARPARINQKTTKQGQR
jgi:hypothetical protein